MMLLGAYRHFKNGEFTGTFEEFRIEEFINHYSIDSVLVSQRDSVKRKAKLKAFTTKKFEPLSALIAIEINNMRVSAGFLCTVDGIERMLPGDRVRKIPVETPFPIISQFMILRSSLKQVFATVKEYKVYPGIWIHLSNKPIDPLSMVRLDATLNTVRHEKTMVMEKEWEAMYIHLTLQSAAPFPQKTHEMWFDQRTGIPLRWQFLDKDGARITYELVELSEDTGNPREQF